MGYLTLMRPFVCLSAAGAAFAGIGALGFPLDAPSVAALTILSNFLLTGGADAINDYFDREIDKVNMPARPIPSGRVSPRGAALFAAALFAAGNLAAWRVNWMLGTLASTGTLISIAYGAYSKRLGLLKNFIIAATAATSLLLAGAALERSNAALWAAGAHLFFMMMGVELSKDVEDMPGDRAFGARTWALKVGAERATRAAGACVAAGLIAVAAAGAAGAARGVFFWPLFAASALMAGWPFFFPVRKPHLIFCATALGVAAVIAGAFDAERGAAFFSK
ncbi:MAG: UbiA family prenyltransferase [Elusimicrobia bacterium]|nr:UbiA family prenyltransferase [Elusimicrobiota bacterium]